MRTWFAVLAMACAMPTVAEERLIAPPRLEQPVAVLLVMERGETTHSAYLYNHPGKGKARKIPSGTALFLTGEKLGTWSEVWVENIGIGWLPTSAIRPLDSRK